MTRAKSQGFAGVTLSGGAKLASRLYHNARPKASHLWSFVRQQLSDGWNQGKPDQPQPTNPPTCHEDAAVGHFAMKK
tara:strand:- start:106 stop:336 length:231 start_codon:yes stop_codon:yes gene_type:complete